MLIDAGCDVNAKNRVGDAPVHVAARGNFHACIKLLGSPQGLADLSALDAEGRSPAEVAIACGHPDGAR